MHQNARMQVEPLNMQQAAWQAVGWRLKDAVQRAGGPTAVAAMSGVPLSTLNGYLAGGEIKLSNLVRLAQATGVGVEWLATGAGAEPPWMRRLAAVSDEKQQPLTPPGRATVDVHWLTKAIEIVEALGGDRLPAKERAIRIARSYEMLMAPSDDAAPLPKLPLRGA